jgi:Uma2 family endonuclease
MATEPLPRLSPDEYLAHERQALTKSEYLNGELLAMTGASRRHNLIVTNLVAALHAPLRGQGCEIYANDMRVRVPATDSYLYPDLVIACGEPRFEDAELDTLLNPILLIEVLSRTTQRYDRWDKFAAYRTLPSLAEYLLVAQDRPHVEQFIRQKTGGWLLEETEDLDATIQLSSVSSSLRLSAIYDRALDFR